MKYAVIVVDMLKDSINSEEHFGISAEAKKIIPNVQKLLENTRKKSMPVIYACDSFMPEDFFFKGRMKPHSLRGTEGSKVVEELKPQEGDYVIEKRRMSSFFRTDLDITLRELNIDTIVVSGIATQYCVLLTALDGIQNGFKVIILEDCCASHKPELHQRVLETYRKTPFDPLWQIMKTCEFLS